MANPTTDGRLLRGERARAQVVEALLSLLHEGELQPTAPRIAERAGVSLRLVFHHFRDLEDLFFATDQRHLEQVLPTIRNIPAEGPLERRLDEFAAERGRILELISPMRRAALLREHTSRVLADRIQAVRIWKRAQVEYVFGPELEGLEPAERETSVAALASAASFSTWNELRRAQGCSVEAATAVMRQTLEGILLGVARRKRRR